MSLDSFLSDLVYWRLRSFRKVVVLGRDIAHDHPICCLFDLARLGRSLEPVNNYCRGSSRWECGISCPLPLLLSKEERRDG